jgi:hypothetical protein
MKHPIGRAHRTVDLNWARLQKDYPVIDGARLVSVPSRGTSLEKPKEIGTNHSSQQVMQTEFESASPSDGRDAFPTWMHRGECRGLMVVENDKVIGLLIVRNIGDLLASNPTGPRTVGRRPF